MDRFRFDRFTLEPDNRRLLRDGAPVELSSRYLDALALMVSESGQLVSKDRFLDEVWRGVPVTDEALTQCIRTLRRQLGDEAARPRFIETVPKHGYRFIAPVEALEGAEDTGGAPGGEWSRPLTIAAAGTVGGGIAGILGGLFYGFAAAAQPLVPGTGATSVLLVILSLTVLMAAIGAAGVSLGIAAAGKATRPFGPWSVAGGALGGLIVGAVVKLIGLDAFNLLFGMTPGDITGAAEGAVLGAAVGAAAWLASPERIESPRRAIAVAGLFGGAAGLVIPALGGRMMGGSLELLSQSVPRSRLQLDQLGAVVGETGFGPLAQLVTGALEGALFAACVVGAIRLTERLGPAGASGYHKQAAQLTR